MSTNDDTSLENRLSRATQAKRALLEKFKRALDPTNPVAIEKRLHREAIAAARTERAARREAIRQEHAREVARQAKLATEAAAEAERVAAEES
jgi:uncharacterized protein DUF6481